jgi:penicillin-binding protein 1A
VTPPPRGRRRSTPRSPGRLDADLPLGRRRRRKARISRRRALLFVALAPLILLGVLLAGAVATGTALATSCNLSSLRPVAIGQNSFVYAADGTLLGSIPAERNRQPVSLRGAGVWMPKATIAIEDRRFYEHGGVDAEGIVRALWVDIQAGRVVEGGSTITQQLVRNLYISRERTLERKIKEACLAIKLNRTWTKDRILTSYLNQVYFGNHAYGVEAAAQTYFSKPARELELADAALLAGLPQAPSEYDPFKRPGDAIRRRDAVLQAMVETRYITRAQYEEAVANRRLGLKAGKLYSRIREPYFFGYVRDELIAFYGATTVRSGGLKVYTTINPRYQRAARKAIRDTLYLPDDPAAAVVSIDPRNGAIRAMAAVTPGRKGNQFNLAAQARRQAGSTFKTFVLTAAVEQGLNPSSVGYVSAPFRYQPYPGLEPWEVSTYGGDYYGYSSVETATLRSDNTVYAQVTLDAGVENVVATAREMGITTDLPVVPSVGLGAASVSPLEMASAYATLAAGGVYSRPTAIRKVVLASGQEDTDAGWGKVHRERVLPDWVAAEVTRVLERNVYGGTGTRAYFGRPMAGKTGTTDNHADAWFCGFVPQLTTTVWVGYPQAQIPMWNVHGISVAGGTFPAEIWRRFMEVALARAPVLAWLVAKDEPQWRDWERGDYALDYEPTTESTTTETKPKPPPPVATTEEPPPVTVEPPPPPTVEPPPPTTEPPPPPPPTEPPPPPPPTEPPPPPPAATG